MYDYEIGKFYEEVLNHEEGTSMDVVGNIIYFNIYKRDISAYELSQLNTPDMQRVEFYHCRGILYFITRFGELPWEEGNMNYFLCTNAEFIASAGNPYYIITNVFDVGSGELVQRRTLKFSDAVSGIIQNCLNSQKRARFEFRNYLSELADYYHSHTAEDTHRLAAGLDK